MNSEKGKELDKESLPTVHEVRRGGRKSLYWASIIAAGGGFVVGFDTGAISGTMVLDSFVKKFMDVDYAYRDALLIAMMLLTATIGGLISGDICGKFFFFTFPQKLNDLYRLHWSKVHHFTGNMGVCYWCSF